MGSLKQQIQSLKRLKFESDILAVVRDNDNIVIDLNTDNQLFKYGIDSLGEKLKAYRSAEYARLKRVLNPNGVTDLKLEGDFYKGFRVDASRFPISITSVDEKAEMLAWKYGEDIYGLTQDSLKLLGEEILSDIQSKLKSALGIS